MHTEWVPAFFALVSALIGLFFGKQYWALLNGLVRNQSEKILRQEKHIEGLQSLVDEFKRESYEWEAEADLLRKENAALAKERNTLRDKLARYDPLDPGF